MLHTVWYVQCWTNRRLKLSVITNSVSVICVWYPGVQSAKKCMGLLSVTAWAHSSKYLATQGSKTFFVETKQSLTLFVLQFILGAG